MSKKQLVPLPGHERSFQAAVQARDRVVRLIKRREQDLRDLRTEQKRIETEVIAVHAALVDAPSEWKPMDDDET